MMGRIALVAMFALAAHNCFAQDKHSLRASVRPNDSVKVAANLPWVSEYQQPPEYAGWWKEIAACEHLGDVGDLPKAVRFVQVNSRTFRRGVFSEPLYGFTDPDVLTIYLAQSVVMNRSIVQHEMMHQYNYWYGIDQGADYHPPDQFEECGLHITYP